MNWQKFKDEYNEGPEDHFDDPYEFARYIERCGDKASANDIRRMMRKREEEIEEEHDQI